MPFIILGNTLYKLKADLTSSIDLYYTDLRTTTSFEDQGNIEIYDTTKYVLALIL